MAITIRERMCLDVAAATYRYPAQREADFLLLCGYTAPRAYQVVNALLDRPDAEAEMPQLVRRLRRMRERRAAARAR